MKFNVVFASLFALLVTGCGTAPSQQDIDRAKAEGIPLMVSKLYSSIPNSAGGVDVDVQFVNTSNKTLKYVVFTVLPYNNVGDLAPSEIGRKTSARLRATGPIKTGEGRRGGYWKNIWYNHSIRCIELTSIELTYMNGSTESFGKADSSKMLSSWIDNSCAVQ